MTNKSSQRAPAVFWVAPLFIFLILILVAPSTLSAGGPTIWVKPPTGGDDTANIQAALDKCMTFYPKGCTVQLAVGTYRSQQVIAETFHGTLQGMGIAETTVEVLAPLVVTMAEENVQDHDPSRTNKWPVLMTFVAGDVTVQDVSFKVEDPNPIVTWCYGGLGCGQTWMEAFVGAVGTSVNLTVQRVSFEGGPGQLDDYTNYNNGVTLWAGSAGPLSGRFKVAASRFKHASNGWEIAVVRDAQFTIGGSPSGRNVYDECELAGILLDADNSEFEYSYNHVPGTESSYLGLIVAQGAFMMPNRSSRFLVHDNTIKLIGAGKEGIYTSDGGPAAGAGKKADFVVTNNTIQLGPDETGAAYAGIEADGAVGALIFGNHITGTASNAIYLGGSTYSAVVGNNLSQFTADPTGGLAAIYLDPATSNDLVLCAEPSDTVLDQGTNNTVIGCQQPQDSPNAATMSVAPAASMPRPALPKAKPWLH